MPLATYTIVLYAVTNAGGPFPLTLPAPSQGTSWVIRDVRLFLPATSTWPTVVQQASLLVAGNQVAATPSRATLAGELYSFEDVRQAVNEFSPVTFMAGNLGWNLQVTGYAFN